MDLRAMKVLVRLGSWAVNVRAPWQVVGRPVGVSVTSRVPIARLGQSSYRRIAQAAARVASRLFIVQPGQAVHRWMRWVALGVGSCAAIALLTACGRATGPSGDAAGTTVATPGAPLAIRYESHLAVGQQSPPGADPHNPKASDPATIKAGETLFNAMNCDGCHGAGAPGFIGPSLADGRWRYGGSDAEVFASIYYGRPKGMPAFGGKLGDDGVWTLVTYLKSLPVSPDIATESWVNP